MRAGLCTPSLPVEGEPLELQASGPDASQPSLSAFLPELHRKAASLALDRAGRKVALHTLQRPRRGLQARAAWAGIPVLSLTSVGTLGSYFLCASVSSAV